MEKDEQLERLEKLQELQNSLGLEERVSMLEAYVESLGTQISLLRTALQDEIVHAARQRMALVNSIRHTEDSVNSLKSTQNK